MESSAGPELPSQVTCFEILPRLPSKSLMRFKCLPNKQIQTTPYAYSTPAPDSLYLFPTLHLRPAQHMLHTISGTVLLQMSIKFYKCKSISLLWEMCILCSRRSVCVNGTIHWMHGTHNPIVVFDIGDEKFRVIPLPEDYTCFTHLVRYPVGNIVGVGGYLGLIESGYAVPFCIIHTDELLLQSAGLSRQNPAYMKVILYNMNNESLRRSDIVFPDKWAYLTGTRFKLLTSYEESIEPLIR
ncbi:hypothetical protein C1H46_023568 [Malus baccata]|uniref:F-box associated domain-containing protein n=1 Tax=Malus baccata TaxID=106549 RepID=A0A540LX38_MALBA|nr:hypothetical protein C1H46_023568 [Malus baccata]